MSEGLTVSRASHLRWCPVCEMTMGEGPDVCLGLLPGVAHACCGHGEKWKAYVVIGGRENQSCLTVENGVTLRGDAALSFFDLMRSGEPIINGEDPRDQLLAESAEEQTHTDPVRRDMPTTIEKKAAKVYRAVLKKTPRTAGELAQKSGLGSTGRSISIPLSVLIEEGSIERIGKHSGNSRPAYVRA